MKWLYTTTTTEKGLQNIAVNLDNVKYIKQKDDGRALLVFVQGQALTVDDTYVKVTMQAMDEPPIKKAFE